MADVKPEADANEAPSHLQIKIKSQDGDSVEFKVKPSTKLEKVFNVYCEKKGLQSDQVKFLFDGEHLQGGTAISQAGLENGDAIDCVMNQVGGTC